MSTVKLGIFCLGRDVLRDIRVVATEFTHRFGIMDNEVMHLLIQLKRLVNIRKFKSTVVVGIARVMVRAFSKTSQDYAYGKIKYKGTTGTATNKKNIRKVK